MTYFKPIVYPTLLNNNLGKYRINLKRNNVTMVIKPVKVWKNPCFAPNFYKVELTLNYSGYEIVKVWFSDKSIMKGEMSLDEALLLMDKITMETILKNFEIFPEVILNDNPYSRKQLDQMLSFCLRSKENHYLVEPILVNLFSKN
jgi:hypothetical protein